LYDRIRCVSIINIIYNIYNIIEYLYENIK